MRGGGTDSGVGDEGGELVPQAGSSAISADSSNLGQAALFLGMGDLLLFCGFAPRFFLAVHLGLPQRCAHACCVFAGALQGVLVAQRLHLGAAALVAALLDAAGPPAHGAGNGGQHGGSSEDAQDQRRHDTPRPSDRSRSSSSRRIQSTTRTAIVVHRPAQLSQWMGMP